MICQRVIYFCNRITALLRRREHLWRDLARARGVKGLIQRLMRPAHIDIVVAELVLRRIIRLSGHVIGKFFCRLNILGIRRSVSFLKLSLPARQCKGDMPLITANDARCVRRCPGIRREIEIGCIKRIFIVAVVDLLRRGFRVVALFIDLEAVRLNLARNDFSIEIDVAACDFLLCRLRIPVEKFIVSGIIRICAVRAKSDVLIAELMRTRMDLLIARVIRIGRIIRCGKVDGILRTAVILHNLARSSGSDGFIQLNIRFALQHIGIFDLISTVIDFICCRFLVDCKIERCFCNCNLALDVADRTIVKFIIRRVRFCIIKGNSPAKSHFLSRADMLVRHPCSEPRRIKSNGIIRDIVRHNPRLRAALERSLKRRLDVCLAVIYARQNAHIVGIKADFTLANGHIHTAQIRAVLIRPNDRLCPRVADAVRFIGRRVCIGIFLNLIRINGRLILNL